MTEKESRREKRRAMIGDDMVAPRNGKALAIGEHNASGFHVRRIVWGRLLARQEKRPGEEIRIVQMFVNRRESK